MRRVIARCAVVMVVLSLFVPAAVAQTTGQTSAVARTWFKIGYDYNDAGSPATVRALRGMIPGSLPTALASVLSEWERGTANKDDVRPALLAHARTHAGWEGMHAFRLGYWCSKLDDLSIAFMVGGLLGNDELVFKAIVGLAVLGSQASEHIDTLSMDAKSDVMRALRSISAAADAVPLLEIILGSGIEEEIADTLFAQLMGLSDWTKAIKAAYGL